MNKQLSRILVFGVLGMVGRTIFKYLHHKYPLQVYGTARTNVDKSNMFIFDVNRYKTGLSSIEKGKYKYFINCIGVLKNNKNKKNMRFINSFFPKKLDEYCKKNNIRLIHISTDAVFRNNAGIVFEHTKTSPSDYYGEAKLAGEIKNGINIRTSVLGFDPIKNKGLLDFALQNMNKKTTGFTNQVWTGSTALQLAQFTEWIIRANNYQNLLKTTSIVHFAPLGPITKYKILKAFFKQIKSGIIVKGEESRQIRILKTIYSKEIKLKKYIKNSEKALKALIKFDKDYVKIYTKK